MLKRKMSHWTYRGGLAVAASFACAVVPVAALAAAPSNPLLPHDLSPWGMFMNADIVVKFVMVGLAFASLITWTVCVAKLVELRTETARARKRIAVWPATPHWPTRSATVTVTRIPSPRS